MLWEHVAGTLGQQPGQPNFAPAGGVSNAGAPPTLGDPMSGPATLMSTLWSSYGPGIVAGGAALLRQGAVSSASSGQLFGTPPVSPPAPKRQDTSQSVLERRKQLESELAALSAGDQSVPMPAYASSSRNSSDADLRGRTASSGGMKFEEIEVPSDVEGYDVGASSSGGEGQGHPGAGKRNSSWFGWGPGKEGYDKVKSD